MSASTNVLQAPLRNASIIAADVYSHSGERIVDINTLRRRSPGPWPRSP